MKSESGEMDDNNLPDHAFSDASSVPLPSLEGMLRRIRSLEKWYAADFERRVSGVTELLKAQITEELRAQSSSKPGAGADEVRQRKNHA